MRLTFLYTLSLLSVVGAAARPQGIATRLDSTMRVAEANGFSGVIRVAVAGTTLLEKGYGLANRAARIPITASTIVQIGSNTKDFTEVAILQLVQAGKMKLSDSIGAYFAQVPADKRAITIAYLLDHRAGFPLGVGGDFEPVSRAQLIGRAMSTPLLFPPGTRESYSNTGFSLLAAIIEQVTRTTYDVYVRDAILTPIGLRRTGFLIPAFRPADLAHGYSATGIDQGTMLAKPHASDGPYWNLRGNGGMLSTVGDMHDFYQALFESDRLMAPAIRALRFNPNEPIGLAGSDGVNVFLYDRFPVKQVEIIIASTNAAMKAPVIRRELGKVLGLPEPDMGGETAMARPGGKPAPERVRAVISALIHEINTNDGASVRRFIAEHFAQDQGGPTVEERAQRVGAIHERLGDIIVERVDLFDDGSVEATLKSSVHGTAVLLAAMDHVEPFLIHSLRVRVGG